MTAEAEKLFYSVKNFYKKIDSEVLAGYTLDGAILMQSQVILELMYSELLNEKGMLSDAECSKLISDANKVSSFVQGQFLNGANGVEETELKNKL